MAVTVLASATASVAVTAGMASVTASVAVTVLVLASVTASVAVTEQQPTQWKQLQPKPRRRPPPPHLLPPHRRASGQRPWVGASPQQRHPCHCPPWRRHTFHKG